MEQTSSLKSSMEVVQTSTGIVIPVYFPPGVDHKIGHNLLEDTVLACTKQVTFPESICLSIDGQAYGKEIGQILASRLGVNLTCSDQNRGKLDAVRRGMKLLLEKADHTYLAVLDSDGDHFPHELLNGVRAAQHARRHNPEMQTLVLGRRISRHRPMGLIRGDLEELADRILLDALSYRASHQGRPLQLEYATVLEEFPDFHSGFKIFSRNTARQVFLSEPVLCGVTEDAYFKHGCESVMIVESLMAGACLVLVNRSTFNQQPISSFGLLDRARMVADKIVWPCRRLGVPPCFVQQWLKNHLPRLLLNTFLPKGRDELRQIRQLILEDLELPADLDEEIEGPLFV